MARLIYSTLASLDGYNADAGGSFGWAAPDDEVHAFVNDLSRPIGTFLLGRRMYETLSVWDELDLASEPAAMQDFQDIWKGADKVVYSRTIDAPQAPRTSLEREFDADAVRALKATADRDLAVGGPGLGAHALRAGLVDELQVFLSPVIVGGGNRALPDDLRLDLEPRAERRFGNDTVYLGYGVRR